MATTTPTTTSPTTQTSSGGSGGNKNINILNTGANAVITVGCCGDSANGSSGTDSGTFQDKPSSEDCAGKLIVLETGDESSTLATGYGEESTLKSKLSSGLHTLQFAICGGPKAVEMANGVENAAMNANVQYEAEYTDGTNDFSGDFLTGPFCLLRAKVTSDQAFAIRMTVYNTGCGQTSEDCSNGIVNVITGQLTGAAAYGTPFTVTASQTIAEFEVCAGEKKFSAFSMIGIPTDIMIDGASVGTTMPTLPFCATTIKVTGAAGVNATILNEICGTECETCGYPRETVAIANFSNPASAIFANGARPSSGFTYLEYTVTVAIDTTGFDCVVAITLHWNGLNNPWNGSGWNLLGIPPMGIPPVQTGPKLTCVGYTLTPSSIEFVIAEYRSSSDAGNYMRISEIIMGTCEA